MSPTDRSFVIEVGDQPEHENLAHFEGTVVGRVDAYGDEEQRRRKHEPVRHRFADAPSMRLQRRLARAARPVQMGNSRAPFELASRCDMTSSKLRPPLQ